MAGLYAPRTSLQITDFQRCALLHARGCSVRFDRPIAQTRVLMRILRFWRMFRRARKFGFPLYEAILAARAHLR